MSLGEPLLEATDVRVAYQGHVAVEGVSVTLARGETIVLAGPNGSGKTSLLKGLMGLVPLQSGQVKWFGQPLERFREQRRLGYVPQQAPIQRAPMTALEVVELGARADPGKWFERRHVRSKALSALERAGAARLATRPFGKLSGGQRQLVLLAKALVGEPDVLLLDEPTTGLDALVKRHLLEWISEYGIRNHAALFMVTHDPALLDLPQARVLALKPRIGNLTSGPEPGERLAAGAPAVKAAVQDV